MVISDRRRPLESRPCSHRAGVFGSWVAEGETAGSECRLLAPPLRVREFTDDVISRVHLHLCLLDVRFIHRCQPSRIRRDSPAFSSDVPRPAKWDRCPAFLENCIIIFFAADYLTFWPCNATKWRTSNTVRSILCSPTDAVYISRAAAVINDCLFFNADRRQHRHCLVLLVTCHGWWIPIG